MAKNYPLNGQYSGGQFVQIQGKKAQDELNLLGCYGTTIDSALRKEPERRGPSDRNLIAQSMVSTYETVTLLTLHEAYFLAFSFGCLSIENTQTSKVLSLSELWSLFREYYSKSQMSIDFAREFAVYHYFRSRGWIVRSGDNFGTNFILYREGPSLDHAQYAVKILHDSNITGDYLQWDSILTYHRVAQSAGKELLIVFILDDSSEQTYDDPKCLQSLKLTCQSFSGNVSVTNFASKTTDLWANF